MTNPHMSIHAMTEPAPATQAERAPIDLVTRLGLFMALVVAPLCAYSDSPAYVLYNELLAILGFGLVFIGLSFQRALLPGWRLEPASALLAVIVLASLAAPMLHAYPLGRALSYAGVALMALLTVQLGARVVASRREALFTAVCVSLVLMGLLNTAVAAVQLFVPDWMNDVLVAVAPSNELRAIGNMRQPNHFASLQLWGCVAVVWLMQGGWLELKLRTRGRAWAAGVVLLILFVATIVGSASRTGAVGVLLLALWGGVDALLSRFHRSRLQPAVRAALIAVPAFFFAAWLALNAWMQSQGQVFFGQTRVDVQGTKSQERLNIFQDALGVLKQHLWTGTGWGDYNFVLTLTPLPERNSVPIQHTHNIFLQFVVELGLPLGVAAGLLLLAAVWLAARQGARDLRGGGICAFMLVLLIGLHSMSEFPVWYAYFLLPTALAYGICLTRGERTGSAADTNGPASQPRRAFAIAGLCMVIVAPLAALDYQRIVQISHPSPDAPPMIDRLAAGLSSPLFSGYAHYGVATALPPGPVALASAKIAARNLSDERLLVAWSRSLAAVGQVDQARFVAQRLKEYHGSIGDDFFKVCASDGAASSAQESQPFQCQGPTRTYEPSELQ